MKTQHILILIVALTWFALPCSAEWGITLRAGYYLAPNWADTYDVIYDNGGELVYGLELDYQVSSNWQIGFAIDMISGDGQRVWQDASGNWIPAGESISFDMMPMSVFTRWFFVPESSFSPFAGLGLGFNQFEETDEDSESGIGFLLLGGLRMSLGDSLNVLLEGEYSSYPDIIGNGDLSRYFEEDDIGGFSVRLGLNYTF